MQKTENEKQAHPLSILAAEVVRHMADKPGTWDFERVFEPHLALLALKARLAEIELVASSAAANKARELYAFHRSLEIKEAIEAISKQIEALKP